MTQKNKNWVEFKEIKQKVKFAEILEHYGLLDQLKRKGDELIGTCPIHKGSNATQFHVSLSKNNYNCFGDCHGGGNILDFVAGMEEVDIRQAALKIRDWFLGEPEEMEQGTEEVKGYPQLTKEQLAEHQLAKDQLAKIELANERGGDVVREDIELANEELAKEKEEDRGEETTAVVMENPPLKFSLKKLDPDHSYLSERGLKESTISTFGLGYCQKGMMAGRIAIPIHNDDGELVAYAGRWPSQPPEGEAKYKLPPGFHKSLVVYNLDKAKRLALGYGLILVEGFFDCMRVYQAGSHNVAALMGSSMSQEQERLIVEAVGIGGKVSLMFDEDEAGWACRDEVRERLSSEVYVRAIRLGGEGLQPDGLDEERIGELLL